MSEQNTSMRYNRIMDFLFSVFLVSLPFMQILTLNVGFPLKIQEAVLFMIILLTLLQYKFRIWTFFDQYDREYVRYFIVLICLVLISFTLGNIYLGKLSSINYDLARWNPFLDGLLKVIYIALAFIVFLVSRKLLSQENNSFVKYYFWGAYVSALCSLFFLIVALLNINLVIDYNIHMQYINLNDMFYIRSGTFQEGNFAGMFFLTALIIAREFQNNKLFIILLFAIISTFSSIAIVGTLVYLTLMILKEKRMIVFLMIFLLGIAIVNQKTDGLFLKEQFTDKLKEKFQTFGLAKDQTKDQTKVSLSSYERSLMIQKGWEFFKQNPWFGVGPSNYRYYFDASMQDDDIFRHDNRPVIANNVYIELLSEYGIFATLIFVIFFITLLKNLILKNKYNLIVGFLSLLLYFVAAPSFSMFFLWVFFAFISLDHRKQNVVC